LVLQKIKRSQLSPLVFASFSCDNDPATSVKVVDPKDRGIDGHRASNVPTLKPSLSAPPPRGLPVNFSSPIYLLFQF
jgi:hypothetical protein